MQDLKEKLSRMTEPCPNKERAFPVSDLFLFFNGSALANKHRLFTYTGIQAREIQVAIRIPENYEPYRRRPILKGSNLVIIFVKTLTGKTGTTFIGVTTCSVQELKLMINEKKSATPDQQRLVYAEKQPEDGRILNEYLIQKGSVLLVILRLRCGGSRPIMFPYAYNSGRLHIFMFSENSPKGQKVTRGTNVEIECKYIPSY